MLSRRSIVLTLTAATRRQQTCRALAAPRGNPIKMFDTDNDATLDLAEVKKAASGIVRKAQPRS